jgi:hypothetical protein
MMTAERLEKKASEIRFLERRSALRQRAQATVRCRLRCSCPWPWSSARVVDISSGGVGLLAADEFELGDILEVELVTPGRLHRVLLDAEVLWKVTLRGGSSRLGCCWLQELAGGELAAILSPSCSKPMSDAN